MQDAIQEIKAALQDQSNGVEEATIDTILSRRKIKHTRQIVLISADAKLHEGRYYGAGHHKTPTKPFTRKPQNSGIHRRQNL